MITTTVNGQAVTNPDGSVTVTREGTRVNDTTGKIVNTDSTTNIQKTSTGSDWTRDTVRTNSNGGSAAVQTTGSSVNNGNGSGSWSSVSDGSATSGSGKQSSWTTDRTGTWRKNADGSIEFQKEADKTYADGKTVDRQTTGTITKDGNTKDIASTTNGESKSPNGKEHDWTTTRNEQIVNNGNGTKTVEESITRTNANGSTTTIDKNGELIKEGNGKWQYDSTATVNKTPASAATATATSNTTSTTRAAESSSKPESTASATAASNPHAEFQTHLENFKKNFEEFKRNRHSLGEHAALHRQYKALSKHWEKHQRLATPETASKWEELHKSYEGWHKGVGRK